MKHHLPPPSSGKRIAFSAYYCNPYLPSEAFGAFRWMEILLENYHVLLVSSPESEAGIRRFYGEAMPENLEMLIFSDSNWFERFNKRKRIQIHFGYFIFNRNLRKYLKGGGGRLNEVDMILHKNPTSFRYPTSYYLIDKPLVIGPIGGGLQVPAELASYFKKEPFLNKLRIFDKYLFRLERIKKPFERARKILITLDYLRDIIPDQFSDKLEVFFDTGIDVSIPFRKRTERSPVKILYLGKLVRFKGAELAIRAFAQLRASVDAEFHIVGDGIERPYLEELTRELGMQDAVTFHGNAAYEEVGSFYENSDIFLYPSLTEASGNVLLEAMKFGLPIIAVNNGGAKYMCPETGTFKVAIGQPEKMIHALVENLELLISDHDRRMVMGHENYKHVREHYSWDVLRTRIFHLVDQITTNTSHAE